ncbi:hypothetical protein NIES4102_29450 [Chondrocystis sp. NIES-4102]|nr:hypothetical protein NIES4102_29450 [Chondrocystis sp. NIES-4102]
MSRELSLIAILRLKERFMNEQLIINLWDDQKTFYINYL